MTDIVNAVAALAAEQATLQTALTTATAQGAQASSVADATRTALSAVQALASRTEAERAQVQAGAAAVAAALKTRSAALAAVSDAQSKGENPPLSGGEADALKKAVAGGNGVSEADLETKGVAAVNKIDTDIAALGAAEAKALSDARADLATKQVALAGARAAAMALLAGIQGSAADITARLNAAIGHRGEARQLAAPAAAATSHHAAVVAYAAYMGERASLARDITTDPSGSWTTAADAWLTALGDAADAGKTVIEKQLALDAALASQAARKRTRDTDAIAAAAGSFGA